MGGEIKDFFELQPQEGGSNSDVQLCASEENGNRESAPKENKLNALLRSCKLREINVRQFPICHGPPDVSEIMQQPKISSIYFLTMPKLSGLLLCMLVQKRIIHWQLEWKFQLISSWTCSLESMNFLSWQCSGILTSFWSGRLQENNPKAPVHDPGKIFATCRPDHRRPKWSPLQSSPACNTLEAEVCLSIHSQYKHHSWCKVLWNLMCGFPSSSTCQWSSINLEWKFGFLLMVRNTMFHTSKFTLLGQESNKQCTFSRKGLVYYVVWTLGEPYLDNNRHYFFDNFFHLLTWWRT